MGEIGTKKDGSSHLLVEVSLRYLPHFVPIPFSLSLVLLLIHPLEISHLPQTNSECMLGVSVY